MYCELFNMRTLIQDKLLSLGFYWNGFPFQDVFYIVSLGRINRSLKVQTQNYFYKSILYSEKKILQS